MRKHLAPLLFIALLAGMTGCASSKKASPNKDIIGPGGHYKIGQPYEINGIWYYPHEDYSYDETGIASWYNEDGARTANGEYFNKNELTAAHKTLPMPTLARITNLDNGRSIVVRINDRGPFSGARIIDVTQRVAQLLGFEQKGTAKVRVQVLTDESKAIADAMRRYGSPAQDGSVDSSFAPPPTPQPIETVAAEKLAPPSGYTEKTAGALGDGSRLPPPSATLPPLPQSKAEARAMMPSVKPVPQVRQLAVTGPNQIYVQAGAFTKLQNAEKVRTQLSKIGKASLAETVVKGVRYYRVRLGPIPNVADADKLLKRVVKMGEKEARIVVD